MRILKDRGDDENNKNEMAGGILISSLQCDFPEDRCGADEENSIVDNDENSILDVDLTDDEGPGK